MDFIEEGGGLFAKLVIVAASLIIPSTIGIYLLFGGEFLEATGHSFLGSILKGIANFIGDATTIFGKFLLRILTEFTLLIIILCIVYAFLKKI